MKKIYISLPISGRPLEEARLNADCIKAVLSRAGHQTVSPFDNYVGKNPTYVDCLIYSLRIIAGCDAIFLCNGWQFSRGCRIERTFAEELGKTIMYESN